MDWRDLATVICTKICRVKAFIVYFEVIYWNSIVEDVCQCTRNEESPNRK